MKYFYDTEFLEGTQKTWWQFGNSKPTIDLISIGIVCEDGREYYAISKDFNLREAWNRYDKRINKAYPLGAEYFKVYWIRDNVLLPIYKDLLIREYADKLYIKYNSSEFDVLKMQIRNGEVRLFNFNFKESYKDFKRLLNKYGKSIENIRKGIIDFTNPGLMWPTSSYNNSELKEGSVLSEFFDKHNVKEDNGYFVAQPTFYGYYSAYDHVALSWIFGKMIDLPKGFPMYTIDLKQMFDQIQGGRTKTIALFKEADLYDKYKENKIIFPENLKEHPQYPKQENEHNALSDAIFVKNLYHFLKKV